MCTGPHNPRESGDGVVGVEFGEVPGEAPESSRCSGKASIFVGKIGQVGGRQPAPLSA